MAAQSDWPLLSAAFDRLDSSTTDSARDITGRGQVPVTGTRSDIPGSTTPERVEALLRNATRVDISGDDIRALYAAGQDIRSILGPRSSMQSENVVAWVYGKADCTVTFRTARVHWPALVEALAAAGFAVSSGSALSSSGPDADSRRQRGAYKGALEAWLAAKPLAQLRRMSVDAIAKAFRDYCERKRPELLPLLPRRPRSMEPAIQRIIDRRVEAAQAGTKQNKGR
jgi:hypothetical protein